MGTKHFKIAQKQNRKQYKPTGRKRPKQKFELGQTVRHIKAPAGGKAILYRGYQGAYGVDVKWSGPTTIDKKHAGRYRIQGTWYEPYELTKYVKPRKRTAKEAKKHPRIKKKDLPKPVKVRPIPIDYTPRKARRPR